MTLWFFGGPKLSQKSTKKSKNSCRLKRMMLTAKLIFLDTNGPKYIFQLNWSKRLHSHSPPGPILWPQNGYICMYFLNMCLDLVGSLGLMYFNAKYSQFIWEWWNLSAAKFRRTPKFHIRQDPNLGPCSPENAPYWDKSSEVVKKGPEMS